MPGEGDSLILGLKTMREKLNIEAMKSLMDAAAVSRVGTSNTQPASAEGQAMPPEIIGVRHVAATMNAVQQVAVIEAEDLGKPVGSRTFC